MTPQREHPVPLLAPKTGSWKSMNEIVLSVSAELRPPLPANPRVIFMGTPEFAVPSLCALAESDVSLLAVVTQPDRPKGRGRKLLPTPVKEEALRRKIQVFQPEKASSAEFCEQLRRLAPDLLVVVAFGQILKKNLLELPSWGVLNIHASLLPRYRGAAPIQWALLKGERKTGLTAMKMDEGMDTGPIIRQVEVEIRPFESAGSLHDRLSALAGPFLVETIEMIVRGDYGLREQDSSEATYAPKIDKSLARIQWDSTAEEIAAQICAFDPWPGAQAQVRGKEVKIFSVVSIDASGSGYSPGTIISVSPKGIEVQTGKGTVTFSQMQLPGKRRLPVAEVVKGFPISVGDLFG